MTPRRPWLALGWCVAVSVVAIAGCGVEKSRNPLSPSIAGPIEGVVISAPMPVTSAGSQLINANEQPITLEFSAATTTGERPFWYEIELATSETFESLVHAANQVFPSGAGTESYQIPQVDADQGYAWRVRALDGANTGPYSEVATFEVYTPVSLGSPHPVAPVGGARIGGTSVQLRVRNATVTGPAQNVRYEFEWAKDAAFTQEHRSVTVPAGASETVATISSLEQETRYHWRSRALADSREPQPITGGGSQTESFMTAPEAPVRPPPGPTPPPAPAPCTGGNPPNMLGVIRQVAAAHPQSLANSCQNQGGSWDFMDRVVETLRSYSQCWGYNCKRGDCNAISHDVVDYHRGSGDGNGSTNVAIIDVIVNHCSSNPQPAWTDVTHETESQGAVGRWKYPR